MSKTRSVVTDPVISHVSDTARWVATYRAVESARPDALFHDHLADRLAGVQVIEIESVFAAAHRFDRLPRWTRPLAWLPQPDPRKPGNNTYSGVVRLRPA